MVQNTFGLHAVSPTLLFFSVATVLLPVHVSRGALVRAVHHLLAVHLLHDSLDVLGRELGWDKLLAVHHLDVVRCDAGVGRKLFDLRARGLDGHEGTLVTTGAVFSL